MSNIITRDYNGNVFQFRADGYFNMTKAAQAFGKHLYHFWANQEVKDYMVELATALEKPRDSVGFEWADAMKVLVKAVPGRNGGTWAHPKLAVFFARWLDTRFAVFCDMVIDDILNKKAELTITKPEESMAMKVPQTFSEALRLAAELEEQRAYLEQENKQLTVENKVMSDELNILTVDEYRALRHLYLTKPQKAKLSNYAKNYCLSKGIAVTKQERFLPKLGIKTSINIYPREALDHAALVLGL